MLRAAHSSDWHLTEGSRFADTLRCVDAFIDDGIASGVGLWLLGGDMSGIPAPHRATTLERNALAERIQRAADHAPVVLARGNHDAEADLLIYGRLGAKHPILVYEEPAVVEVAGARVFVFPYPFKAQWVAPHAELSIDEQDRAIEDDLGALLLTWQHLVAQARAAGMPTIFTGHVAIRGSMLAGGERQLPPGQEIELTVEGLTALGCDYTGDGHIHLCQELAAGSGIWIVGSPDRSNFGEETDAKGWNIVDLEPGRPAMVHRRQSPARRFVTGAVTWSLDAGDGVPGWVWTKPLDEIAGAEVRVLVSVPVEAAATAPVDQLEAMLRGQQAHDVRIERRSIPTQEIRCEAITRAETEEEMLVAYWDSLGGEGPDREQRARAIANLQTIKRGEPVAVHAFEQPTAPRALEAAA